MLITVRCYNGLVNVEPHRFELAIDFQTSVHLRGVPTAVEDPQKHVSNMQEASQADDQGIFVVVNC